MFEAQIEDQGARRRWLLTVPLAVAIHVLALGAAVFAQLWKVETLPEPSMMVPFITGPEIPVQLGRTDGDESPKKRNVPAPPVPATPPRETQPVPDSPSSSPDVPSASVATSDDSSVSDEIGTAGGAEGGPRGLPDGVIGGTSLDDTVGIPGGGVDDDDLVRPVGGAIAAPRLLMRVEPVYCDLCRRLRIEGRVMIEAVIDAQGRVRDARVISAADERLVPASLAAVRQWQYEPARLQGRPVPVYLTVTILFTLK